MKKILAIIATVIIAPIAIMFVAAGFSVAIDRIKGEEPTTIETPKEEIVKNEPKEGTKEEIVQKEENKEEETTINTNKEERKKIETKEELKKKAEKVVNDYNVVSLDILTLTKGGYSVSVQIKNKHENPESISKKIEEGLKEITEQYDITIIDDKYQIQKQIYSTENE